MKKAIVLIVLFLFAGNNSSVAQSKFLKTLKKAGSANAKSAHVNQKAAAAVINSSRPSQSVNYYWDMQNLQWVYTDSSFYTYTLPGDISSEIMSNNSPVARTTYTYDTQNRLIQELYENWDFVNNAWVGSARYSNKYNTQGYLYETLFESYNTSSNLWEIQYGQKNLLTYDASNRVTDNIYQSWDPNTNTWENNYRESDFTFDANNNITKLESYSPNGSLWDKDSRMTLVYALNNQPTQLTSEIWNGTAYTDDSRIVNLTFQNWCGWYCDEIILKSGTFQTWSGSQWDDDFRISTTFDAFGGYIQLEELYTGTAWENSGRSTESYDLNSNYTGYKFETWDNMNNAWDVSFEDKQLHTYDMNSNITQTIWQYWDSQNMVLENNSKKVYSNFKYVSIKENANEQFSVNVFPNPCSGECHLRFEGQAWEMNAEKQFALFDVQGKEILSETTLNSEFKLNTEALPKGLYFYTVKQGSEIGAKGKLLVE